ncbi:unnamed protein product [Calypogeia fissa]
MEALDQARCNSLVRAKIRSTAAGQALGTMPVRLATLGLVLTKFLMIPEEEKELGPQDWLIHVYHFTQDTSQNHMVQNFREPFFLVVRENETLVDAKERIRKKSQVADDVVANCFQGTLRFMPLEGAE